TDLSCDFSVLLISLSPLKLSVALGGVQRAGDSDFEAAEVRGLECQHQAVQLGHALGDVEPDALAVGRAGARGVGAKAALEDARALGGGDAGSVVDHREPKARRALALQDHR